MTYCRRWTLRRLLLLFVLLSLVGCAQRKADRVVKEFVTAAAANDLGALKEVTEPGLWFRLTQVWPTRQRPSEYYFRQVAEIVQQITSNPVRTIRTNHTVLYLGYATKDDEHVLGCVIVGAAAHLADVAPVRHQHYTAALTSQEADSWRLLYHPDLNLSADPDEQELVTKVITNLPAKVIEQHYLLHDKASGEVLERALLDAQRIATEEREAKERAEAENPSTVEATIAALRSVATAAEAWATDMNRYPAAKNWDELGQVLTPTYIRTLPRTDMWGTPFQWQYGGESQGQPQCYAIISAGADKRFETTFDPCTRDEPRISHTLTTDIVYANGQFLTQPAQHLRKDGKP